MISVTLRKMIKRINGTSGCTIDDIGEHKCWRRDERTGDYGGYSGVLKHGYYGQLDNAYEWDRFARFLGDSFL
jgi:hypothetical protein